MANQETDCSDSDGSDVDIATAKVVDAGYEQYVKTVHSVDIMERPNVRVSLDEGCLRRKLARKGRNELDDNVFP